MKKLAVLGLAVLLSACGGGGGGGGGGTSTVTSPSNPSSLTSTTAPPPSNAGGSTGSTQNGSLSFLVFDSNVASPATTRPNGTAMSSTVNATAQTITFATAATPPQFATSGLVIGATNSTNPTFNGISGNMGGGGMAPGGNGFQWCAGGATNSATSSSAVVAAQNGQVVAISGNATALSNVAPLYGLTLNARNCDSNNVAASWGDGAGNLTLKVGPNNFTQTQVLQMFTSSGLTLPSNMVIKLRAYSFSASGTTAYAVVAILYDPAGGNGFLNSGNSPTQVWIFS